MRAFIVAVFTAVLAWGCTVNIKPTDYDLSQFDFDQHISFSDEGYTLRRLKSPVNIRVKNGVVYWNKVKGASGYLVNIDGLEIMVTDGEQYDTGDSTSTDVKAISVMAIGNGLDILDSHPSMLLYHKAAVSLVSGDGVSDPAPLYPIPISRQIAWHKLEQYAFIHFGPNTFRNAEWGEGKPGEGAAFAPTKPSSEYTLQWVKELKKIGMNGIILTVKHHDGFCLWQSKTTLHSLRNPNYSGGGKDDVARDLAINTQANNMNMGLYVSPWDRNNWCYYSQDYVKVFEEQVREVATQYGPLFEIWFDGATAGSGWYGGNASVDWHRNSNGAPPLPLGPDGHWKDDVSVYDYYPSTVNPTSMFDRTGAVVVDGKTYSDLGSYNLKLREDAKAYIKTHQPNVVIFGDGSGEGARWIGNEQGWAGRTCWSMGTGVNGNENATAWFPGECDMKTHSGWFHSTANPDPRGGDNAWKNYIEYWYRSVGRNANLLLNFSPARDGLIPEKTLVQARKFWQVISDDFATNLALQATAVEASNIRSESERFTPLNLIDEDFDTYWATDDTVTADASVTLKFDELITFDRVMLQEYIVLGQRVKSFKVEYSTTADGDDFKLLEYPPMPWGIHGDSNDPDHTTTIGYKRILRCYETQAMRVRVTFIKNRKPVPFVISKIGLYNSPTAQVLR